MTYLKDDTMRGVALGRLVRRATGNLPQTTHSHIFQVVGGRVLITMLLGHVTTAIASGTNHGKVTSYPTTGTAVDLCAGSTNDLASAEEGTHLTITGTFTAELVKSNAGAVTMEALGVVVPAGYLDFAATASKTGQVQWTASYVPLDDGAHLVAA